MHISTCPEREVQWEGAGCLLPATASWSFTVMHGAPGQPLAHGSVELREFTVVEQLHFCFAVGAGHTKRLLPR